MPESDPVVRVHVNIEVSAAALQAVVARSKEKAAATDQRRYHLDTADTLAALISRFLREQGFERFAADIDNY